jgi:hypothetical protein
MCTATTSTTVMTARLGRRDQGRTQKQCCRYKLRFHFLIPLG